MSPAYQVESRDLEPTIFTEPGTAALKVYVHVANGYDALKWQKNWKAGKILGLNEEFPYGYHRAAQYGTSVAYSRDYPENRLQKFVRYAARGILGFDFIHAWRNRHEIFQADVVWTHTESQSLAILLLFKISRRTKAPKLIGQVVWLIDEWPRLSFARKKAYTWLLQKADILTFLSPLNADVASRLFPRTRVEFVKFGINMDYSMLPATDPDTRKIRVLGVGNDRHRDWPTLINSVKEMDNVELHMLTKKYKLRGKHDNISVVDIANNAELLAQFEWADMLVLTLTPNYHASGITVIEEAVILGLPVICSKVGGVEAYFSDSEVLYVDPFDCNQVREAIHRVATDSNLRKSLITNSRRRMIDGEISSQHYAKRHVELSREICGDC
jgi:glycosyltransferase involved in cell wall biosynthesis